MSSHFRICIVSFILLLQFGLLHPVYSTQQYPVFTNAKPKVSVKPTDGSVKLPPTLKEIKNQKPKLMRSFQYNGFITVNESRRFFVNAKPLSQHAELKLVSVMNAGRSLVLQHKTRGRINLHLGQTTGNNK